MCYAFILCKNSDIRSKKMLRRGFCCDKILPVSESALTKKPALQNCKTGISLCLSYAILQA